MKIINVNNFYETPLTVDSTLYTADSTELTADMVSLQTDKLFIKVIPRQFPTEVIIQFYNELKQTRVSENCFVVNENGYMTIPFNYKTFEEGDSFEIKVTTTDGVLLYRDKAEVHMTDDLQNYKLIQKDANNVIKF